MTEKCNFGSHHERRYIGCLAQPVRTPAGATKLRSLVNLVIVLIVAPWRITAPKSSEATMIGARMGTRTEIAAEKAIIEMNSAQRNLKLLCQRENIRYERLKYKLAR